MDILQNKQTVRDILRYIKLHSKDDVLSESMMSIGKRTGYSNATVHRTLKHLEKEGYVQIIETKHHKKPNKIFYIGPDHEDVSTIQDKVQLAINDLQSATENATRVMMELKEIMTLMGDNEQDYINFH